MEDLQRDMNDGVVLIQLIEVVGRYLRQTILTVSDILNNLQRARLFLQLIVHVASQCYL